MVELGGGLRNAVAELRFATAAMEGLAREVREAERRRIEAELAGVSSTAESCGPDCNICNEVPEDYNMDD